MTASPHVTREAGGTPAAAGGYVEVASGELGLDGDVRTTPADDTPGQG